MALDLNWPKKFAEKGARLILWDSNSYANQITENICRKITNKIICHTIDITNRNEIYTHAEIINNQFGCIDFLINNAGIINVQPFVETQDERMDLLINVNVKAIFWVTKAFLPQMLKKGSGHIISLSSVAGLIGAPSLVDYSASKFAVYGFMEALEHQLLVQGHLGIDFTTVCPIYVQTSMLDNMSLDSNLPILKPEYVAKRIIEAIQINQRVIILPKKIYWIIAIKRYMKLFV